ncbi:hypothetical protein [Pedobacter boryungensis]|uniref:Glycosyl transferase family 8 n=1 Tax=Pedobacter boryungensis TaxID=869962 RepID=A0ABX2D9D3_9SPHI|nr:hypothetical protein [Pedobacter boryungensis]NQX30174.1 hypothetical protein [Pedobacter boryungensis]
MNRNILTIATGKKLYVDLAVNLARSFYLWHQKSDITFFIVTDLPHLVEEDVLKYAKIITVKKGELGEGFSPKLHLDKLAPEGQTLFIDSDCLIFGNLDNLFERFKGKSVSVVGGYIADGEWFGEIKEICKQFNIPHIPKFNGGIYYLEKGKMASKVYAKARELEKDYDKIGFVRLRNRPNDEVLMALAMQLYEMTPLVDDGTIMSDPQACPGGYEIDVITGKRWMLNPPKPSPLHQDWYPFEKVEPIVVHFLGYYTQHYPYKREVYLLDKKLKNKLNWSAKAYAKLLIESPERIKNKFKKLFRPIYRVIFGTRKIVKSERIV